MANDRRSMTENNLKQEFLQKAKKLKGKSKAPSWMEMLKNFKTQNDLESFLKDLLTPGEIQDFSARWEAAQLIQSGYTYREVSTKTGLSTATVTRVARSLFEGTGYRKALKISQLDT